MILEVSVNPGIRHKNSHSPIMVAVVGKQGVEHISEDGELVYVTFDDGSVYEIRNWGWKKKQHDREKARREISEKSAGGAEEKDTKAGRARSKRAPVRSTKKVRKKSSKAKGSKLQSSSGKDVRPSVHAPEGGVQE